MSDFNNYLLRVRRVTEKKAITYLAAWKMIPEIKDLSDLSNARLNENQTISFRNFLHFMQDVKCVESINGFKIDKWLTLAKIHRGLPKLTFINSKDVYDGFKNCPEELKTFYKLLAYSGGRGEHLKKMIETFEPDRVIFSEEHPGVCAYPVTELCSGNKNIFFVYFPTEFLKELRDYCLPDLHIHTIYKSIRCGNVSTKNLRKWHANLFLTNGVQESALDFIHGRTPRSVVAKFYTNLNMQACRAYAETINKFPIFD